MKSRVVLCLPALVLGACLLASAAAAPAVYVKNCSGCHGTDGRGKVNSSLKGEVADLHSKEVQGLTDEELYETIARGTKHKNYPHAFLYRGLTEKDIHELVKYIRTLSPLSK